MYPKTLFQNVLLLDGKIINWKTGTTHWDSVDTAFHSRQRISLMEVEPSRLRVESVSHVANDVEKNNAFFADETFYRQFEIHEDYGQSMFRPYAEGRE